jgi:hypothetical protein
MIEAVDFQVRRDDLRSHRLVPIEEGPLADGEVRVRVDHFAFTANNVTYAVFGDGMNYWDFFPAEDGWGRIPVWGFGDVVASRCTEVAEGERLYGYFPMSTSVVIRPVKVGPHSLSDGSTHREHLHPVYNSYQRVAADPSHEPGLEAQQMLMKPLFTTSWLIDDFLADADFFGAKRVVLTSASSKTALGLAHGLAARGEAGPEVVGLTSPGNVAFCEGLGAGGGGLYDRVVAYDDLETLDASVPTVSVDMAGNGDVLRRIHEHLGDALTHSMLVGGTHWEARSGAGALPGPEPALFFAPAQVARRMDDWGGAGYAERAAAAWSDFVAASADWLDVRTDTGGEAVARIYLETLEGRVDPKVGQILSLSR